MNYVIYARGHDAPDLYPRTYVPVYIYRGYLAGDTNKCAVPVKGEGNTTWKDRSLIYPVNSAETSS